MSYDISFQIDTGGNNPATLDELSSVTWNLGDAFEKALGHSIRDLSNQKASDCVKTLEHAHAHALTCASEYDGLYPNDWGTHEDLIYVLSWLFTNATRHPNAIIIVE